MLWQIKVPGKLVRKLSAREAVGEDKALSAAELGYTREWLLRFLLSENTALRKYVGVTGAERDKKGKEIIAISNLTPVFRSGYEIGVPYAGTYEVVFNSDEEAFGGTGKGSAGKIKTNERPMHGHNQSVSLELAGLSTVYLKLVRKAPAKKEPKKVEKK